MDGDKKQPTQPAESAGWSYKPEPGTPQQPAPTMTAAPAAPAAPQGGIEWSASEFIAHDKGFGWYALLAVAALVVSAGLYLVTKDIFSSAVVLVMAAVLGVSGARKPRTITYHLDNSGLRMGKKFYPYSAYKSFAIPEDGPFASVILIPMKRLDFPISAYLAPDSEQKAIEILADHLPMERGGLDSLERIMRTLRF